MSYLWCLPISIFLLLHCFRDRVDTVCPFVCELKPISTNETSQLMLLSKFHLLAILIWFSANLHFGQHPLEKQLFEVFFLMESKEFLGSPNKGNTEELPSLIKNMTSKSVVDFDDVEHGDNLHNLCLNDNDSRGPNSLFDKEIKATTIEETLTTIPLQNSPVQSSRPHRSNSISLSMLASPSMMQTEGAKRVMFGSEIFANEETNISLDSSVNLQQQKLEFISQPPSVGNLEIKMIDGKIPSSSNNQQRMLRNNGLWDKRFDSFKTWPGKIERQLSSLRGRPQEPEQDTVIPQNNGTEPLQVHRFFDALEGPELETLKASEVSVLPDDKPWPFLLRFPVSAFGICLGVSSQAILWKTLVTSSSTRYLHITPIVNLVLWCIAVALVATVSSIYLLKIILYFEAFRREYYHPIRVNFFFAPWIAGLFLALGIPPSIAKNLHASLWYILMAPIFCLELKIYGQWMSGGQRRLSKVANPSNHLSIVGNFVGALLGATMGLKEGPIFFFSIGLAHYTVLFVTLYQRLPTNETLPKELHPVFCLFVAAPSVACTAWAKISGSFGYTSRIAYFIALFLYFSLAVRINFFRGFRFSLAWWAYTFPMTGASIATIAYSAEVNNPLTKTLSVALSAISTLASVALLVSTILHAFVMQDLFPNDVSIAITQTKDEHLPTSSLDTKDLKSSGFQKTIRHVFRV